MATQTFLWIVLPNGVSGTNLKFSVYVAPRLDPQRLGGAQGFLSDFSFGNWTQLMQSLSVTVTADSLTAPITATRDASSVALDPNLWTQMFPSSTPVNPWVFIDYSQGTEIVSYEVDLVDQAISTIYSNVIGCTPPRGQVSIAGVSNAVMTGGSSGSGGSGGNLAACDCFHLFFDPDDCPTGSGGTGGTGGTGGSSSSANGASATADTAACFPSPNALEAFITTVTPIETTLVNFASTPTVSQGESASSVLSRMGVSLSATQQAFFNFQRFFNRYGMAMSASPQFDPVPGWSDRVLGSSTQWDFHQIVTMLADFPVIMRKLGFVIDFTIPVSSLAAQTTGLTLSVSYGAPAGTVNVTPKTMAIVNATSGIFRAADRSGSLLADGMLTLDNTSAFQVVQGQTDGSAAKVIDSAFNEFYRVAPTATRQSKETGSLTSVNGNGSGLETCSSINPATSVPALRSGVQVIQRGRAAAVANTFNRQAAFNSAMGGSVFYSDDLMRGYRVDVNDRGNWRSLCARQGTVGITSGDASTMSVSLLDEGYVKAVSATKKNGFPWQLFIHESLWGWDNWSLAAPHPGKTVADPTDSDYSTPAVVNGVRTSQSTSTVAPTPVLPFDITTVVAAQPGTLPKLRFGNNYQFRARVVDLAGNSLPLGGVTNNHATPSWTYHRFEPVLSPAIVPTARFTNGESLETLVVRQDLPNAVSARFIAPPKASQLEIELHGKLDAQLASGDVLGAFNFCLKESGTYLDPKVFGSDANAVVTTNDPTVPEVRVSTLTRGKVLDPIALPDGYMIYKGPTLPLPYLPDPFASGIAVYLGPGGPGYTQAYSAPTWDTAAPIRFELHPGTGTTTTVTAGTPGSTFVVTLPPATILEQVDYTSTLTTAALTNFHHWQNGGSQSRLASDAANGQIPLIAPPRRLRLVHAVKKPLAAASVSATSTANPLFTKNLSDNYATILAGAGTLSSHSHSTGEVEMFLEWTETQDLLGGPPAFNVARRAFAHRVSVPYGSDTLTFPSGPTHNVSDTTCGLSTTTPDLRVNFGDTKYRSVQIRCTSSTRFTEYYAPSDLADPSVSTLTGNLSSAFAVANSARAPKPDIAYVVPTFSWTTSTTSHTRTGGNVRIYMNRPWFSTGDGELLGVLVGNVAAITDVGDQVRPYVTEMGYDPVYADSFSALGIVDRANGLYTTLTSSGITSADATGNPANAVLPAELSGVSGSPTVVAVGHTVHYSPERDLWYTDVSFNMGFAYAPFVKLAVARYQPNSVKGIEISAVVRIDCIQLPANRTASIVHLGPLLTLTVSGQSAPNQYGVTSQGSNTAGAGHVVTMTVDSRPKGGSDLDWRPMPNMTTTLGAVNALGATGATTWTGSFTNTPATNATTEYRLRVEEVEQFNADAANGGVQSRPVFVDTFPL
jgi:hypothetical protein